MRPHAEDGLGSPKVCFRLDFLEITRCSWETGTRQPKTAGLQTREDDAEQPGRVVGERSGPECEVKDRFPPRGGRQRIYVRFLSSPSILVQKGMGLVNYLPEPPK